MNCNQVQDFPCRDDAAEMESGTNHDGNADITSEACSIAETLPARALGLSDLRRACPLVNEDECRIALQFQRPTTSTPVPQCLQTLKSLESTSSASDLPSPQLASIVKEAPHHPSPTIDGVDEAKMSNVLEDATTESINPLHPSLTGRSPSVYKFPPTRTWAETFGNALRSSWMFLSTIKGFLITIYALNVVAWGGMIFLLLIGGGDEYMCWVERPIGSGQWIEDCNDIQAPRRIWIEIDAQILNALFCVTGIGLSPWRFRDWYYLIRWRLKKNQEEGLVALRRLAAWHTGWFRLPGSSDLDPEVQVPSMEDTQVTNSLPEPIEKAPAAPLTGVRAAPTSPWKLDFVVWMMILNTVFQIALAGCMWGMNRYNRPSWTTALLIVLAMSVALAAGIVQFLERKRIKKIEGVPMRLAQSITLSRKRTADEERIQADIAVPGMESNKE